MNLTQKFMYEISNIKSPEYFVGLARTLNVKLVTEEKDEDGRLRPRDFSDIFADVMRAYDAAPRKLKRDLLKMLREANAPEA